MDHEVAPSNKTLPHPDEYQSWKASPTHLTSSREIGTHILFAWLGPMRLEHASYLPGLPRESGTHVLLG
jgi:hypothetical protein